jgi:glycosyltransferase involved in cell wall biosynthesis
MKILYDISWLGFGHYNRPARTGIFRVIENLAYGLAASEECELNFCASFSLDYLNYSIDYWQTHPKFRDIPFIYPEIATDVHKHLKSFQNKIRKQPDASLLLKSLQTPLHYLIRTIEKSTQLLSSQDLSDKNIFHSPYFPLPDFLNKRKEIKRFLTVHDLIPILFPHFFKYKEDQMLKRIMQSLTSRDWVFCVSQSTKNDLCNYLKKFDPERVFVTYLAASDYFYPCFDPEKITQIKTKYQIPPDATYILSLSTLEPRKNIDHTIRCFAQLVEQEKINDLYLVLVGVKGWNYDKIFEQISHNHSLLDRIIVTGYVADEDLAALYSNALVFVYSSFYEGFGLPPLEAMQCGVPVITSNTSSLPEVVGDAGIMVSPTDTDALGQSLLNLYNQPSLRAAMSLKSLERAKQFSWEKCTQQTINAYKIAVSS